MATVIDALMVTLGLDAKKYNEGVESSKKTLKSVGETSRSTAKEMDDSSRKMVDGYRRVRQEILGFYALLTAGRGIKTMISDIIGGDAAMGRFSKTIGGSVETLTSWQGVVERFGGSAGAFANTARTISSELERVRITGQSAIIEPFWKLGVNLADQTGKARQYSEILMDTADAIKRNKMTQPQVGAWFGGILDDGTIAALMAGRQELSRYLEEQKKLGTTTEYSARQAQEMKSKLLDLQQGFEGVVRTIVVSVSPAIIRGMTALSNWVLAHRQGISDFIDNNVKKFFTWLETFDWDQFQNKVSKGAHDVYDYVLKIVKEIERVMNLPIVKALGSVLGVTEPSKPARTTTMEEPGNRTGEGYRTNPAGPKEWKDNAAHNTGLLIDNTLGLLGIKPHFGDTAEQIDARRQLETEKRGTEELIRNTNALIELKRKIDEQVAASVGAPSNSPLGPIIDPSEPTFARKGPGRVKNTQAAKESYDFWIGKGFTPAGAAGMVANEMKESGGDPRAVGDNGQAVGLYQWHPDRVNAIFRKTGIDIRTAPANMQREAFYREGAMGIDSQWGRSFNSVKNASDPYIAGATVSRDALRPGARLYEADDRGSSAQGYDRAYNKANMSPPTPVPYYPGALRMDAGRPASTSTNTVTIGSVVVNTQAKDAQGISRDIKQSLSSNLLSVQSNSGLR